jgi:hypothetical protein
MESKSYIFFEKMEIYTYKKFLRLFKLQKIFKIDNKLKSLTTKTIFFLKIYIIFRRSPPLKLQL